MVSIADGLANRYQGTTPDVGSSLGSAITAKLRIDCGTTSALFAGTRFWAISCSAVSSRDDGTTRKAGRMLSTVLPSSPVCFAICARALPRLATSRAVPLPTRFLCEAWNSATPSAVGRDDAPDDVALQRRRGGA